MYGTYVSIALKRPRRPLVSGFPGRYMTTQGLNASFHLAVERDYANMRGQCRKTLARSQKVLLMRGW